MTAKLLETNNGRCKRKNRTQEYQSSTSTFNLNSGQLMGDKKGPQDYLKDMSWKDINGLISDCNVIIRNCISSDSNQVDNFPMTQHGTTSAQKMDILFPAVSMARLLQFNHMLQISISWWNRNQILLQTTQIQSRETIHILWSTKPHWEKESAVSTLESWSVKPEGNASIYGNLESR